MVTKVCSNGPGPMTKMAATSIYVYGTKPLTISKTKRLMDDLGTWFHYVVFKHCQFEDVGPRLT